MKQYEFSITSRGFKTSPIAPVYDREEADRIAENLINSGNAERVDIIETELVGVYKRKSSKLSDDQYQTYLEAMILSLIADRHKSQQSNYLRGIDAKNNCIAGYSVLGIQESIENRTSIPEGIRDELFERVT